MPRAEVKAPPPKEKDTKKPKGKEVQNFTPNGTLIALLVIAIILFLGSAGWFGYTLNRTLGNSTPTGVDAENPNTCLAYYQGVCVYQAQQVCFFPGWLPVNLQPVDATQEMVDAALKYIPENAFIQEDQYKPIVGNPYQIVWNDQIAELSTNNWLKMVQPAYNSYRGDASLLFAIRQDNGGNSATGIFIGPSDLTKFEYLRICEKGLPQCIPENFGVTISLLASTADEMPNVTAASRCDTAPVAAPES
nr:hypothetical protein [Sicyoidochytrium minutum DNA virus]